MSSKNNKKPRITRKAITHSFPIVDEMDPHNQQIWFSIVSDNNGVCVFVSHNNPQDTPDSDQDMALVNVDFFNDRLRSLSWDKHNWGKDPYEELLVEKVSTWKPRSPEEEQNNAAN